MLTHTLVSLLSELVAFLFWAYLWWEGRDRKESIGKTQQEGGWKCKRPDGEIIWLSAQTLGLPRQSLCGVRIPPVTPNPVSGRDHGTHGQLTVSFDWPNPTSGKSDQCLADFMSILRIWEQGMRLQKHPSVQPSAGKQTEDDVIQSHISFFLGNPPRLPCQKGNKGRILYSWAGGSSHSVDGICSELKAHTS